MNECLVAATATTAKPRISLASSFAEDAFEAIASRRHFLASEIQSALRMRLNEKEERWGDWLEGRHKKWFVWDSTDQSRSNGNAQCNDTTVHSNSVDGSTKRNGSITCLLQHILITCNSSKASIHLVSVVSLLPNLDQS